MREVNGSLPSGWIKTILSEVTLESKTKAEPNAFADAPYIGLEHIESGRNRIYSVGKTTDVKSTKNVFQRGDVLYGKLRPYLKKAYRPNFDGVCSTDILVFSESPYLDNGYLLYFLLQQSTADYATQNSNGINLPRINSRKLGEVEFPLPPLVEQRRIVVKIEALQKRSRRAREALTEVGPLLEQFRQSVLAAAFRGDLTADWRAAHPNVEPASELLQRIRAERRRHWEQAERAKYGAKGQKPPKDWQERYEEPEPVDAAELPELPAGWEWAAIAQLGDCVLGKMLDKAKHQTGVALPYLRNINIRWDKIVLDDLLRMYFEEDEFERYGIRDGDVLICEGGEPGRAAVWQGGKTNIKFQKALHRVRLFGLIKPSWLIFHLWKDGAIGKLESFFTGTTIKHFTGKALAKYPIPVAPWNEQVLIIKRIRQALRFVNSASNQITETIAQCSYLDQAILAKAFRGELVPQDPNDEPASVLLNRIRQQRAHQTKTKTRKTSKT